MTIVGRDNPKSEVDSYSPVKPPESVPADKAEQAEGLLKAPTEPMRDRIVILGRRRSGKTIFLARLYEQLWRSTGRMHMRAISGETHKACLQVIQELRDGRWPASTLGAQYSDIEITYQGQKHLMVALDYPGEVFRKAFVDNAQTEDARELLEHVDKAAAVILLLDPSVIESSDIVEAMDDDYGMVQAVHRIREWPGGEAVPIVIVFTKCDIHKNLLREHGGLKKFVAKKYPSLIRAVNYFKIFASAAVRARPGDNGAHMPNLAPSPVGLVEPIEYCLNTIIERRRQEERDRQAREMSERQREMEIQEHKATRRAILFWSIFWSVTVAVMAIVGTVAWIVTQREIAP